MASTKLQNYGCLVKKVPEHLRISSSDLHMGEFIGYGSSSMVTRATWLCCDVAVKELIIHDFQSFKAYPKELEILVRLPHPHVVQLLGFNVEAEQRRVSIVMEHMETSLSRVIFDRTRKLRASRISNELAEGPDCKRVSHNVRRCPFAVWEAIDITTKIALGMKFLHSREVVHGALSSDIILMNLHAESHFDIKIAGFAFSDYVKNLATSFQNRRSICTNFPCTKPCCKPFQGKISKAEDVYSFALICYAILTGCKFLLPPWNVDLKREEVIEAVAKLELPPGIGDNLAELILKCGDADPKQRPGFPAICDRLANIRAACDQALKQKQLTEDCALQWTTHKDDEGNKCLEIASILETLPIHLSIDPADVEWRRPIGAGGNNEVYEVNWLGCAFAVKRFKSLSLSFKDEVEFLTKLQHPHIARLMGVSIDDNGGWIMMERMDMDLRKLINSRLQLLRKEGRTSSPPFSGVEAQELCLKVALGLNFLHSKNVVHRDIKAANVLVHDHHGRFDVKITDFGASHRIGNPNVAHRTGTSVWRAPEVLRAKRGEVREEQLMKTDVYSFAMTCYEILTGNAPHEHVKEKDVIEERRPKLPAGLHPALAGLISQCWDDDPEVRPNSSAICHVLASIRFQDEVLPHSRVKACVKLLKRKSLPFTKCLGLT